MTKIIKAHYIKEFLWLNGKPINYELDKIPEESGFTEYYGIKFRNQID